MSKQLLNGRFIDFLLYEFLNTEVGAIESSLTILEVEETPLAYFPEGVVRLRVKAIGDMAV